MTSQELIHRYAELKSRTALTQENEEELLSLRVRIQRTERMEMPSGLDWVQGIYGAFNTLLHRIEALEAEVDILREVQH